MAVDAELLSKVSQFLRVDGSDDQQNVVAPIVQAGQQYLTNAGVAAPADDASEEEVALYELAVTLYANKIYYGDESNLDAAMTSIILQLKDYTYVS